jgi:hypothetical protein
MGGWAAVAGSPLKQCREVEEIRNALFACWQELTERMGATVSVRTTNIGQQFTVRSRWRGVVTTGRSEACSGRAATNYRAWA